MTESPATPLLESASCTVGGTQSFRCLGLSGQPKVFLSKIIQNTMNIYPLICKLLDKSDPHEFILADRFQVMKLANIGYVSWAKEYAGPNGGGKASHYFLWVNIKNEEMRKELAAFRKRQERPETELEKFIKDRKRFYRERI